MLIVGLGVGALASQLGSVTVSAVPTEKTSEVGGLQNTATQLGASLGTALAGSVLIAALTASFLTGIQQNPNVPEEVKTQASANLAAGVPFISQSDLKAQMTAAGASAESPARSSTRTRLPDRWPARAPGGAGLPRRHRPVLLGRIPKRRQLPRVRPANARDGRLAVSEHSPKLVNHVTHLHNYIHDQAQARL